MKRFKKILICIILACGAIAGAAVGILIYQAVKAVEEKIKDTIGIKKLLSKLPLKRRSK